MNQIKWINILKGIGIISVVLGHIYEGDVRRYIYMFHMPLFFFLSGYLLRPNNNHLAFLLKKIKSLLIPYVAFLIPIYLFTYGLPSPDLDSIKEYLIRPIIGGQALQGRLGVLWFITCLFLTQQIVNYIITKFSRSATLAIMIGSLFVSYINSLFFHGFWLPWNANTVLASAPILYCGYLYAKSKFELNKIILISLGLTTVIVSHKFPGNLVDMKYINYGYPLITFFSGLVLILNLKLLAYYISKVAFLEKLISKIGEASMVIMYLHLSLLFAIMPYVGNNKFILSLLVTVISFLIYYLISKLEISKALYLGDPKALKNLKNILKGKSSTKPLIDSVK